MKRPQAILFDRLSASDQLYAYPQESLAKLAALVPHKGVTLDVGCGDGIIAHALGAPAVFGVDVSHHCVHLAVRRGVYALIADAAEGLPFPAATFDCVYCVDVLHHLGRKWDRIFFELDRVLKPAGTLAIVEPDARNPFVRWTQAPNSPIRVAPWNDEPAIYPAELLPHLESRGYAVSCDPIHIAGEQTERDVFPLWQRIAKAPFTLTLAFWYRNLPNKFAMIARKPCN